MFTSSSIRLSVRPPPHPPDHSVPWYPRTKILCTLIASSVPEEHNAHNLCEVPGGSNGCCFEGQRECVLRGSTVQLPPTPPPSLLLLLLWLAEILFCKLRKFQLLQTSISFFFLNRAPIHPALSVHVRHIPYTKQIRPAVTIIYWHSQPLHSGVSCMCWTADGEHRLTWSKALTKRGEHRNGT